MLRLALLIFHSCPAGRLGEKDTGGMNVYVRQLARELGRRGHQVDLYTRRHHADEPQIIDIGYGARVIHLDAGPPATPKEDLYAHIPAFIENLCRFRQSEGVDYDLLHSHYWLSGRVGVELSRRWDIPHIATFHTLARTKQRARAGERESAQRAVVEKQVMNSADAVVVSTHIEKADTANLYQANITPVRVVPPGVDLTLFQPVDKAAARKTLGLTDDKRIVLYVGRIEPLKGLDILLRAAALLDASSDTRLLIVGGSLEEDAELEHLKRLALELDISDIVTFTGSVNQEQLPAYYSAADVFVLPSWYESFGLAALEAMSCGTPVVVSRVGGLSTFVENGKSGYLIPWRCPEPFAQSLDTLLANPLLRSAMGSAGRRKALRMSWAAMADGMLNCYSEVIGRGFVSVTGG